MVLGAPIFMTGNTQNAEPMAPRSRMVLLACAVGAAALLLGREAAATPRPLCPAPAADDVYYSVCRSGFRGVVARFVDDFTVDQLHQQSRPFRRDVADFLTSLGVEVYIHVDDALTQELLEHRSVVEFNRLDAASGEFISKGGGNETFELHPALLGDKASLQLQLPETVQGLYWRSPLHLEFMFYQGHRVHFRFNWGDGTPFEQEVACISVTPERTLVTTTDPDHRQAVIMYENCQ